MGTINLAITTKFQRCSYTNAAMLNIYVNELDPRTLAKWFYNTYDSKILLRVCVFPDDRYPDLIL